MDVLAFAARTLLNLTPFGGLLGGGSLTPARVAAGLLALAASRWQKDRLAALLRVSLYSLGVTLTLGLSKWPLTGSLWNRTIEPYFIELLDVLVLAVRDGFIRGLRSDNRSSDRMPSLLSSGVAEHPEIPQPLVPPSCASFAFQARLVSLVICRDEQTGKYLAVREASGWSVLTVEARVGQTLGNAAVAHAAEQAGAQIKLAGLLTAELTRGPLPHDLLLRVVFFARPLRSQLVSAAVVGGAGAWFSLAELTALAHTPAPDGLVGHELLDWAAYLKGGGTVFPLELLTGPADAPSDALRAAAAALAADTVAASPVGNASHSKAEAKQLTAPAKGGASAFDVAGAQLAAVFASFGRKSSKAE